MGTVTSYSDHWRFPAKPPVPKPVGTVTDPFQFALMATELSIESILAFATDACVTSSSTTPSACTTPSSTTPSGLVGNGTFRLNSKTRVCILGTNYNLKQLQTIAKHGMP